MMDILIALLHLLIFPGGICALGFGLWLQAVDRRFEARLQRRVGPPLTQPFLDLLKLCTKEVIIPGVANKTLFLLAPILALAGMMLCAALVPVPGVTQGLPAIGDLLVLFYLLPLSAMALMLAGSASGSPYGGIGFAREMLLMLVYELPLLIVMLTIAIKVGGSTGTGAEFSLSKIIAYQNIHGSFGFTLDFLPALLAFIIFLPATLGVLPFDLAEAESEILEGPLLEYSGVLLAFFKMAAAVKQVVVLSLGVILFFPGILPGGIIINLAWFGLKILVFVLILTVVKANFARFKIDQALSFFFKYPTSLALLALLLVWMG